MASNLRLVTLPERRNPRTGLPEQAYYRPPDPKNIKAAKNGLFVIGLLVWMALPLWLEFLIERGK
jgi:hypothetical protein